MTLRNAAGNILNKTELTALTTQVTVVPPDRVFTETIYETYANPGEGDRHETGKRKRFIAGQRITQAQFDALFGAATVTSITPATGAAAGNTAFTIRGTALAGVEGVDFDGAPATQVKVEVVNGEVVVTGRTPAGAAGPADVVVKDDAGDVNKPAFFTYT